MARSSNEWDYAEVPTGHAAPITMPDMVADLLSSISK